MTELRDGITSLYEIHVMLSRNHISTHVFFKIMIINSFANSSSGWSRESLEDWGIFGKLAFFGLMMTSIEWWAFEVGMFLAGND